MGVTFGWQRKEREVFDTILDRLPTLIIYLDNAYVVIRPR